MKLIVHELESTVYQEITTGDANLILGSIRPHIYKHASPAGTLTIEVQDTDGNTIAVSDPVTISTISGAAYFHGFVRFYINAGLRKNTTYRITLIAGGGYAFSESAYIGWCKDWEAPKVDCDYSPAIGVNAALDLELWNRKEPIRGIY